MVQMIDDVILTALFAGIIVAFTAGILGCFVAWNRMSYFGDALAHSALLGIALGMLLGFSYNIGTVIVAFIFALFLVFLQQKKMFATDTILGILAHSLLAIGMIAIGFAEGGEHFHLHDYLFGDILEVNKNDLYWVSGVGAVTLILLRYNWSSLTLMSINEDLARSEGVNILKMNIILVFLITLVISASINVVGVLLVVSMLIIPPASARLLSNSPETMAIFSALAAVLSVLAGIWGAMEFNIESGPAIVTASTVFFILIILFSSIIKSIRN